MSADEFAVFGAAGARVVPVEDLGEPAAWIASHRILLIDTRLTTEQRHQVACVYLPAALAEEVSR